MDLEFKIENSVNAGVARSEAYGYVCSTEIVVGR